MFIAKFVWSINEAKLEVLNYNQRGECRLLSTFDFAKIYNDSTASIVLVTRLVDRFEVSSKFCHPFKLIVVVGLENRTRNFISIVDIRVSKVLNTLDFPSIITSLEVCFSDSLPKGVVWPLVPELACMAGIVAVGCESGIVYFVDLILDSISPTPLIPKKANILSRNKQNPAQSMDLENKRRRAIFHNQYVAMPLNSDARMKNKFNYCNETRILDSYHVNDVYISSLHFIPQLAFLCVGYNFGGFHLYNLNTLGLECSSEVDPQLLPTIAFAFQIPEHDPRNYCYLTVVRGTDIRAPFTRPMDSCCTAVLYLLNFEIKEYIASYGLFYSTFNSCQAKFEFILDGAQCDSSNISGRGYRSKLISMYTINQIVNVKFDESAAMDQSPVDHNYLFIAWQTEVVGERGSPGYYFLILDLNQWYKSQMPRRFYLIEPLHQCPFLSFYSLNNVVRNFAPEAIQSISVANNTLSKYSTSAHFHEMHLFPASLSFTVLVALQTKLCSVNFKSEQKRLLAFINATGSSLLVQPEDVVSKCLRLGIILPEQTNSISPVYQALRKLLLNVALENKMIGFLVRVAQEWASGGMESLGCDLSHLLEWCWAKVGEVKRNIDAITFTLFSTSGCALLEQDKARLVSFEADLSTLALLIREMEQSSAVLTEQSADELAARKEAIELLRSYLKLILLFVDINLLPERPKPALENDDNSGQNVFVYDYTQFSQFYQERRKNLGESHLLIDIILKHINEPNLWEVIPNDPSTTTIVPVEEQHQYPPPSIYSLVRLFLNESIPLVYKESILFYFLLDFSSKHLKPTNFFHAQHLSSLHISQSVQFFLQGLYLLDHEDYDSALQFLTHPMVSSSLPDFKVDMAMFNELMQGIVALFQLENEFKSALVFIQSCGHFPLDNEQNESLYLQLLLLNDNLAAAFEFQRDRRTEENVYTMLYRLLYICEKKSMLEKVARMSLDEIEENIFVDYLHQSDNVENKKILILYFIVNNKLVKAIRLSKEFEHVLKFQPAEWKRIEACTALMPSSMLGLVEEMDNVVDGGHQEEDMMLATTAFPSSKPEHVASKLIQVKPKQKRIPIISTAGFIEKEIEDCESMFNDGMSK